MAVVKGTNAGFVTVAPVNDPAGSADFIDTYQKGNKDTSPADAVKVTEIGWYCSFAQNDNVDFAVGIYSHDAGNDQPLNIIGQGAGTKGTTAGWKKVTGLNIVISGSTIYWIMVQLDDTSPSTYLDYSAIVGERYAYGSPYTELQDPWAGAEINGYFQAIYAVYETAVGTNIQINIGDVWKDVSEVKINIEDAWKDVTEAKINIGDAWKDVF